MNPRVAEVRSFEVAFVRKFVSYPSDDERLSWALDGDRAPERSKEACDPDGKENGAEDDGADRDDTMLQEGERVPTAMTDVVVGALHNDDGDDGHNGHNEWVQVKRFFEVAHDERDACARESAAGAGMTRHDRERTDRDV